MNPLSEPAPYPLDAFPLSLRRPLQEVLTQTQAPDALVAMSFLMTMSASAQGLYDVRMPTGQVRPVSTNLLVIAESGERKTAVDSLVSAPIQQLDAERIRKHEQRMKQYKLELEVWTSIHRRLLQRISKLAVEQEPIEELEAQLREHAVKQPERPRLRRLLHHNATERGLMDALEGEGESIGFLSDEGEIIIKGGVMRQLGLLNKMWDGARTLSLDRSEGVNVITREPRLTLGYMIQPALFNEMLARKGETLRGSGHWARFLVGFPASKQGTRHIFILYTPQASLSGFHDRVRELVNEFDLQLEQGVPVRQTLTLAEDAIEKWIACANEIEEQIHPWGGELHEIKDFASKAMEIACRVSALLHVFSGQGDEIPMETFERAIKIVVWHLLEFRRVFTQHPKVPQEYLDAVALENYLHKNYYCRGYSFAFKNSVLRSGPVRPKANFDVALEILIKSQKIWIVKNGKTSYIYLNVSYFSSLSRPPQLTLPMQPLPMQPFLVGR